MPRWTILTLALLIGASFAQPVAARSISMQLADWHAVTFDGKKPTDFRQIETRQGPAIAMRVNASSSFRVHAFSKAMTVSRIAWSMRYRGLPMVENKRAETSKAGDDFVLRVGLITAGERDSVPFFAPGWIKDMGKILKLPAGKVIYLVASRYHAPGSTWPSPYSGKLSYASVAELKDRKRRDWFKVDYTLPHPVRIVGLWLMADGDNTHSDFTAAIRGLRIH